MVGRIKPKYAPRIANFVARWGARLQLKVYRTACENLAVAFPHYSVEQRQQCAQASLANAILVGLETFRLVHDPVQFAQSLPDLPPEIIQQLDGKAAIVCLPHLGNWEVFAQIAPRSGRKTSAIAKAFENTAIDNIVTKAREKNGLHIIKHNVAGFRVRTALRNQHLVGMLVDQNLSPQHKGIFIKFFGLPATMSPLPAYYARKLNVPIVICASVRQQDGSFKCLIQQVIQPAADDNDQSLSQAIASAFEHIIRQYPEQYTWNYKRWRYIPSNTPPQMLELFPSYAVKKDYCAPDSLFGTPNT